MSVPPGSSSHTPESDRHVIRITRLALLGVVFLLFGASFPAAGWPAVFGWLLLVPVALAVYVLRNRTTVTNEGLVLRSTFGSRTVAWADIKGVRFPKRGWARADLTDDTEVPMPAVGFDRIRELSEASGGRIPDPYSVDESAEAADSRDTDDHE